MVLRYQLKPQGLFENLSLNLKQNINETNTNPDISSLQIIKSNIYNK